MEHQENIGVVTDDAEFLPQGVSLVTSSRTERELAALAAAFVEFDSLTPDEREFVSDAAKPDRANIEACRALIAFGLDPLGESFLALRSPERRRDDGAVYTPEAIVKAMIEWASGQGAPARVVDPGCGSGRFISAAARAFPGASLVACDTDPLALLLLRAKASVQGFADRLSAELVDYRELRLPNRVGRTLFIGNPPFVRHHKLSPAAKTWFVETARRFGYKASKLSGLHAYFFLRTRELARTGDYGAFVTSAEWMDVNYGSVIREMLGDGLGGAELHLLSPGAMPFGETMTTGAITCFRVGERPTEFLVRELSSVNELDALGSGKRLPWEQVSAERRWSQLFRGPKSHDGRLVELGELFRVHRGTVTGNNGVFLEGVYPGRLPARFLIPAVTKARDLFEAGRALGSAWMLRRVIALPAILDGLTADERMEINAFLAWAKSVGADASYTARARSAWWSVPLRDPAPILCTYMARRPPAFVRNLAGARHINIAHGLYPRVRMSSADLDAYAIHLSARVSIAEGRTYAGGLTKFEPKEIERIRVPCLNGIREAVEREDVDRRGTDARCGDGAAHIPR